MNLCGTFFYRYCLVAFRFCVYREKEERREKRERRKKNVNERNPACSGLTYRLFFLFYPSNSKLTYRQNRFYALPSRNRHFVTPHRLIDGNLNEKICLGKS